MQNLLSLSLTDMKKPAYLVDPVVLCLGIHARIFLSQNSNLKVQFNFMLFFKVPSPVMSEI